jgi:hypothetical protein
VQILGPWLRFVVCWPPGLSNGSYQPAAACTTWCASLYAHAAAGTDGSAGPHCNSRSASAQAGGGPPQLTQSSLATCLAVPFRYNALLAAMCHSLAEAQKALKGLVVMSPELDALTLALYNNQAGGSS